MVVPIITWHVLYSTIEVIKLNKLFPIKLPNNHTVRLCYSSRNDLQFLIACSSQSFIKFNLPSVGQLTMHLPYDLIFTFSYYIMHDQILRTTVGAGDLRNDLYFLVNNYNASCTTCTNILLNLLLYHPKNTRCFVFLSLVYVVKSPSMCRHELFLVIDTSWCRTTILE